MTAEFQNIDTFREVLQAAPGLDCSARDAAQERNSQLTKPPGALGRLEDLAIWYCGWRGDAKAEVRAPQVIVFAGNHGVTARGVSAFPAEVTVQMVANFEHGGAAINQLAKAAGARLDVHPLSLETPTGDFTQVAAMDDAAFLQALNAGWAAVDDTADLLVVGEMGIGNTTSAAAIAHVLFGEEAADWVGRGTGVDDAGLALKATVVAAGVALHAQAAGNGLEALRCLGGRELAAMAGAIARARVLRIPVILDGFICTAAAACLEQAVPGALDHAVAGHASNETAHGKLLAALDKTPLLALGMRLGEASGGTLAINIVKSAVACHSGMATFAEAGVAEG